MKKIRVGIIGLGYWGPNLLRVFNANSDFEVTHVCDLDQNQLKKYKTNYPSVIFTKNSDELFSDKKVDAIAIATPVSTHFELAIRAIRHHKHLFIEKPLAKSVKEVEKIISESSAQNLVVLVDHTYLYSPSIQKVIDLVIQKDFGKILYLDSERTNLGLIQQDVNVIWDLAPHDISIILGIIGKRELPIEVFASGSSHISKSREEMAHIIINFTNEIVCHVHVSWLSPVKSRRLIIGGQKKMICFNDVEPTEKVRIYNKSITNREDEITPFNPVYRSGDIVIPDVDRKEPLLNAIQDFSYAIQHKASPISNAQIGLEVVKILEAADRSLHGKKLIKL